MNNLFTHKKRAYGLLFGIILLFVSLMPAFASVELIDFDTENKNTYILVYWETASELDNLGFHLWRSTDQTLGNAVQITDQLIPSKVAGQPIGAEYEFEDRNVDQNVTYYYWLQDFDFNGSDKFHPPVDGRASTGGTINTPVPDGGSNGGIPTSTSLPTSTTTSQQPATATRTPTRQPTSTNTPVNQPSATNTPQPQNTPTNAPTNTATPQPSLPTTTVTSRPSSTPVPTVAVIASTPTRQSAPTNVPPTATTNTVQTNSTETPTPVPTAMPDTAVTTVVRSDDTPTIAPTTIVVATPISTNAAEPSDNGSEVAAVATIGSQPSPTAVVIAGNNAEQGVSSGVENGANDENAGTSNIFIITFGAFLLILITGGVAAVSFMTSRNATSDDQP